MISFERGMQSAEWKTLFDVGSRHVYLCHFIHDVKREIGFVLDISERLHITIPVAVHRFQVSVFRFRVSVFKTPRP